MSKCTKDYTFSHKRCKLTPAWHLCSRFFLLFLPSPHPHPQMLRIHITQVKKRARGASTLQLASPQIKIDFISDTHIYKRPWYGIGNPTYVAIFVRDYTISQHKPIAAYPPRSALLRLCRVHFTRANLLFVKWMAGCL